MVFYIPELDEIVLITLKNITITDHKLNNVNNEWVSPFFRDKDMDDVSNYAMYLIGVF